MWLKIGEFAQLARVSARMLRHYDRAGLFKPGHIDASTGYRYYSIEQLPHLKRICALRDLAFTLDDIAALLAGDESMGDVQHLLQRKRQELRQRIADDQARIQRIETRLRALEQGVPMQAHSEHALLMGLLTEQYGIKATHIEQLYSDTVSRCYHVADASGKRWEASVGRADALADSVYTTWLSGYGGCSLPDFQLSRAGVLAHLEAQRYPSQRLQHTLRGEVLSYGHGWSVLLASELPPLGHQPVLVTLRGLGAALGHLHSLSIQASDEQALPIGQGWFYPEQALREALHHLAAARSHIPPEWHPLLGAFLRTMQAIQQADLPRTITHGDPLLAKAAQTNQGVVTLREWHSGGLGVAVLDLGRLLLACHWNPGDAWPYTITPSQERIGAVLDGYSAYRKLRAAEREMLREAIGFSVAYGSAEHIARALAARWTPKLEQKLAARKQWFEASAVIAQVAQPYMR